MAKRIFWKKGMRLTDEILKAADNCHHELLTHTFALASVGRFGLFPSVRDFNISVSINKNLLEIEALNCLAITKSGDLIDVNFDTTFTSSTDTRLEIPSTEEKSLLLVVQADSEKWEETYNGYCEPVYTYSLITEHRALEANQFPVARIVEEYGWRLDEINFVPPCLYISSHPYFTDLSKQFCNVLKTANNCLMNSVESNCKTAIGIFLPIVQQLKISMDKEKDTMTPMELFANVQKFISGFYCGCIMDETLTLTDTNTYINYIEQPYNYRNVHLRIKEGLSLCTTINEKIEKFKECKCEEVKIEAPTISNTDLIKKCTNSKVRIPVVNNASGSTIYYTVDGSEPTTSSSSGNVIMLASGFVGGRDKEEADRIVTVKVKAMLNGVSSETNTYRIRLQKDIKHWIEI